MVGFRCRQGQMGAEAQHMTWWVCPAVNPGLLLAELVLPAEAHGCVFGSLPLRRPSAIGQLCEPTLTLSTTPCSTFMDDALEGVVAHNDMDSERAPLCHRSLRTMTRLGT